MAPTVFIASLGSVGSKSTIALGRDTVTAITAIQPATAEEDA